MTTTMQQNVFMVEVKLLGKPQGNLLGEHMARVLVFTTSCRRQHRGMRDLYMWIASMKYHI